MHTERTQYPSKEEILDGLYLPTEKEFLAVKQWKTTRFNGKWKQASLEEKHAALSELIMIICASRGLQPTNVPQYQVIGEQWMYRPNKKTIIAQTENPSIVSALHELGHHLFGASETNACRFSIGIFIACFPRVYKTLEWQGHMLRKPK